MNMSPEPAEHVGSFEDRRDNVSYVAISENLTLNDVWCTMRHQLDRGSLRTVATSLRMLWSRDLIDNGRPSLH